MTIGGRDAPGRVVAARRMAFPTGRPTAPARAARCCSNTTRGRLRNPDPAGDLGRVTARARVAGPVRCLDEPVRFGERAFTGGHDLRTGGLAPYREDLVLRDPVPRPAVFPAPVSWSVRLRRTARRGTRS
ncbi:hypothetical protein SUDANB106_04601 [Streptomyces sp. enrichment culture]|uniref:hypothetical protein n=1 Tax=Streptomyces sp. enrichment culture TaxID=1795815 RepID=UPI003F552677